MTYRKDCVTHIQQTEANVCNTIRETCTSVRLAQLFCVSQTSCFTRNSVSAATQSVFTPRHQSCLLRKEHGRRHQLNLAWLIEEMHDASIAQGLLSFSANTACRAPDCPTALKRHCLKPHFLVEEKQSWNTYEKMLNGTVLCGATISRGVPFHCAKVMYGKQRVTPNSSHSGLMRQPARVLFHCANDIWNPAETPVSPHSGLMRQPTMEGSVWNIMELN